MKLSEIAEAQELATRLAALKRLEGDIGNARAHGETFWTLMVAGVALRVPMEVLGELVRVDRAAIEAWFTDRGVEVPR